MDEWGLNWIITDRLADAPDYVRSKRSSSNSAISHPTETQVQGPLPYAFIADLVATQRAAQHVLAESTIMQCDFTRATVPRLQGNFD